jgi:DNA-binding transcriptional MocR family regulator
MEAALHRWLPDAVKWTRPHGGYMLWLQLPQSVKAMELHALASERGISIAPGPMFSATHAFQNCVRLNFGHPWDARFENAIRALAQILDSPAVRA